MASGWFGGVSGTGDQDIMAGTAERRALDATSRAQPGAEASLSLLGAFELKCDGDLVSLPVPAQRLLAFIALQDRPLLRGYVGEMLWLESTGGHASGSLRTALWRLRRPGSGLVDVSRGRLRLEPGVVVDVRVLVAWARRVLDAPEGRGVGPPCVADLGAAALGDLLPDWYDDWLVVERERLRDLRARALERACERLAAAGDFAPAVEAGLTAVRAEPLRESAHRGLIGVYLAEGNQAEALREYHLYRDLLHDKLGLDPSARMEDLVRGLVHE